VDGEWIPEESFARGVRRILAHVKPLRGTPRCPTFFELITALALLHFADEGVDAAVLEVGLGGRLDATSAVRPLASVVTQVGLDHTAILGPTRALIAAEKAGVAKRGVPLLTGIPLSTVPGRVIAARARDRGAPLSAPGRDFAIRTGRPALQDGRARTPLSIRTAGGRVVRASVPVLGRELARDAGLAAAALMLPRVARRLPAGDAALLRGLEALHVPGRIEVTGERPLLVVDGAHNPDSARALARTILEALSFRRAYVVLGGGRDKSLASVVRGLALPGHGRKLLFTRPASHPRAADPEELARACRGAEHLADLPGALARARALAGPRDLILVTGSLYLAGEALTALGRS
jgi:folylpolyglutamate synthase/dihydrofolate synthase